MEVGSVTSWLIALKHGDPTAAQKLWERDFARLAELARHHLRRARRQGAEADEEDVALAAFDSFFRGAENGRFPRLDDREDLWQILVMIASRKAATLAERGRRLKRGSGRVFDETAFAGQEVGHGGGDGAVGFGLDDLAGPAPTPEFVAEAAEACRRLLDALGDDVLRQVALWKLEGYTHEEIRVRLGCALRTVTNKLELIRRIWVEEGLA